MKPNIFGRETWRQPIRTLLLLVLVAGVVFAFTARAAEYLLLRQETERLGSYYKAVGFLGPTGGANNDDVFDGDAFSATTAFLQNDPRVAYVARREALVGLLPDMYNADINGSGSMEACKSTHLYFTGTLLRANELPQGAVTQVTDGHSDEYGLCCYFRQEQPLAGAPELLWSGRIVRVFVPRKDMAALPRLHKGQTYLLCGYGLGASVFADDITVGKATVEDSVVGTPLPMGRTEAEAGAQYALLPLIADGPLLYQLPESGEIDWSDPALAGVEQEIATCREEMGGLAIVATGDMDAMSRTLGTGDIYPVEGRWFSYADEAVQNRVCVIHEELAAVRGLAVGDSIDITLRDINIRDTQNGYIIFPFSKEYESVTQTYRIIGTYNTLLPHEQGFTTTRNVVYLPHSTVPESFQANDARRSVYDISFALTSPALAEEFLADTHDALAALGARASMRDSGWEAFWEAVRPMLRASLYNVAIFALVLLTALCLVAFLYLRARRKDVAIARALGVPGAACVRQGALPLALLGLVGTVSGAVAGWQYALATGTDVLATLRAFGAAAAENMTRAETAVSAAVSATAETALPRWWLALILGGILLLCLLLAYGGMLQLSRRPTLELLAGGNAPVRQKEQTAAQLAALDAMTGTSGAGAISAGVMPLGGGSAAMPRPAKRSWGVAHTLRFVGCYIRRAKVKSALVLLLALLFTVGLAAIRIAILHSGERVDELFDSISISMSLAPESSASYVMGGGFVACRTVDRILDSGLVRDAYLEGQCAVLRLRREDVYLQDEAAGANAGDPARQAPVLREGDTGEDISGRPAAWMLSFDDLEEFMTAGSGAGGEGLAISWQDGWDASMFAQDYTDSDILPVVMPAALYEALQIPANGRVALDVLWEDLAVVNARVVQVAGTYTGTLTLGAGNEERSYLLAPAGVMDAVMDGHTAYSTARFALDPACNHRLEDARATLEAIAASPDAGLFALRAVVRDEELTQAVEPLESSIQLIETLFPVALALSLLAAAGVLALLVLTEARQAAILRVLDTTRLRSRILLALQVLFMVLGGLTIGLAISFAWAGSMGLAWAIFGLSTLCAAAYLLCATAGPAAGAERPPLDLLQTKE